mmetsp:Transcript_3468/g.9589  ORF Transcript_3468/g.9589 Transcript_3468/m.9589 type:complete len:414 (+) Transcript_3468:213-1454(+)
MMVKRKRKQAPASDGSTLTKKVIQEDGDDEGGSPTPNNSGVDKEEASWSKSKKKRMRRLQNKTKQQQMNARTPTITQSEKVKHQDGSGESANLPQQSDQASLDRNVLQNKPKRSSLIESFKARLSGSRFRSLNEELYTMPSQESFSRFTKDPTLFQEYHDGFRHQVSSWPVNPITVLCQKILKHAQKKRQRRENQETSDSSADSGNHSSTLVVADFGCGEAQLAAELLSHNPTNTHEGQQSKKPKGAATAATPADLFQVHSFDLVAPAEGVPTRDLVTPCDMSRVPLPANSVDVGVFCLSLMGTNLADFIREAHRVLKANGTIWIAEVQSRFFDDTEKQKTRPSQKGKGASQHQQTNDKQLQEFLLALKGLGFQCVHKDFSNKMFFVLQLVKNGKKPSKKMKYTAKPCIYKRR